MGRRLLVIASLFLLAVVLFGCGDDDAEIDAGATTTAPTTTDPTTTAPTTTAPTTAGTDDGELPGEPWDGFPSEGAELAVVGVESDDVLNVRSGPGVEFDIVAELEPLAERVIATGDNRMLDSGVWVQVTADGVTGWANYAFLTHLGSTDDITAQLFPDPADRPDAGTMEQLAEVVVGALVSEGPPLTLTVADGPEVGDLAEITVDARGLRDDSAGGYRLVIFAVPDPAAGGFVLRTVESTVHCTRGVTDEGRCI